MPKYITVDVTHANASSPALTGIALQLDNMPVSEVLYYEGDTHIERFRAYTQWIYDIRQNDLFTDVSNIDPVTSTNYRYRVIDIPESSPTQNMRMTCDLLRGGM